MNASGRARSGSRPASRTPRPAPRSASFLDGGCAPGVCTIHLCFQVDDIQKTYEQLKARGTRFHREPDLIGEAGKALADHWYVYLRGPDNEVLELIQRPRT